jgi:hypothetical protein
LLTGSVKINVFDERPAEGFARSRRGSGAIASVSDKENENRDRSNHDEHPVLGVETQN